MCNPNPTNPNDFQTFSIREPNPNKSETNPKLPYNPFQSESSIRINSKSFQKNFNPFQSLAPIRRNPKPIRTHILIRTVKPNESEPQPERFYNPFESFSIHKSFQIVI